MKLEAAARHLETFQRGALTKRLAELERTFTGVRRASARRLCRDECIDDELVQSAVSLKRVAGQVNVLIHAIGIIMALPRILEDGERVESLSLGAGNTGRPYDLVTNRRIAEFKFIRWTGRSETIRQNSIFKDFFGLAESGSRRRKYLYLLDLQHPLRFLTGGRALASILSRNAKLALRFKDLYRDRFRVVSEYYSYRRRKVSLVDLAPLLPALTLLPVLPELAT